MSEWIEAGQPLPAFALQSDDAGSITSEGLLGRWVVLYFYPKDETPGCTKEACAFRDIQAQLAERGAVVLGVSPDSVAAHQRFRARHALSFSLLSDPAHALAEACGAWREKTLYGRKSIGIVRSTFLVDPTGTVARVWKKVAVEGHAAEVLAALDVAQAG